MSRVAYDERRDGYRSIFGSGYYASPLWRKIMRRVLAREIITFTNVPQNVVSASRDSPVRAGAL